MRTIDADALKDEIRKYANEPSKIGDRRWDTRCTAIIADMNGLINKAPTVGGWISVKDGLPKEMQDVLLKFPSNMAVGFYVEGGWMVYSGGDWTTDICEDDEVPQYWMPLPEPPKEVDDERSNGNA